MRDDSLVMIDVAERGATEISVLKGEAYAETRNGKIRIPAGNTLLIREDLRAEFYPLAAGGEWEAWNRARDRMLARAGESCTTSRTNWMNMPMIWTPTAGGSIPRTTATCGLPASRFP
jgi:hypothetical protein